MWQRESCLPGSCKTQTSLDCAVNKTDMSRTCERRLPSGFILKVNLFQFLEDFGFELREKKEVNKTLPKFLPQITVRIELSSTGVMKAIKGTGLVRSGIKCGFLSICLFIPPPTPSGDIE